MLKKRIIIGLIGIFIICVSFFMIPKLVHANNNLDDPYFEYPTETWIIEKQDYFGCWLEWNFIPVNGQHGDKVTWNFTWNHLPYLEIRDEVTGEILELAYNPIFEIREAIKNETKLKQIYDNIEPLQFKTWGKFKSDVMTLDNYDVIPEDKEEFGGKFTTDIFNFDSGSFIISFKDRWKSGKKVTIGFGSTITYSGITNTITCTGGTVDYPITFWDLWNASDVNNWNIINNTCNTQFKFWCKLQIGDGSILTWFADVSKQVLFADGITTGDYQRYIDVKQYATFRLGTKESAGNRRTYQGCSLIDLDITYYNSMIQASHATQAYIYLYSCHFIDVREPFQKGTWVEATEMWNCIFTGRSYPYFKTISNAQIYNTIVSSYYGFYAQFGGVISELDNFFVSAEHYCFYIQGVWVDFTFSNAKAFGGNYLFRLENVNNDVYAINVEWTSDNWVLKWSDSSGKLYRQYTFNLELQCKNNTYLENANVTLSYSGQNGGIIGSWLTNSTGQIPEQTLSMGFYNQTGGNTIYDYNPYNLTVTKTGFLTYIENFTLTKEIDWNICLVDESVLEDAILLAIIAFIIALFSILLILILTKKRGK